MAHASVIAAVQTRLETYWQGKAGRPLILEPNKDGDAPGDGAPWMRLQFPAASERRPIVNRRLYREEGGFRIVIAVEIGEGLVKAPAWAAAMKDLFRDRKFSGVRTFAPGDIYVGDENDEGNYFVTALVVPYAYTFIG
ncbi:phage tail terminator-like protein [Hansschlegelia sp.]|uniref:phage tail terminator-like protein n=1 Tax=Hansschlegelia sp. TaxID=2041892 RepID=UPI002CA29FF0|nr:phage tail terminator-like protein [Hansschlegelia sp.]HVI27621.1 phage tail terminator-like protein [Hansschlegelia sp.]